MTEFFINDFQREIWEDTYRHRGESIHGTMSRLVEALYEKETKELKQKLYKALINRRISFGGRVVANTGIDIKNVLSFNCYSAQRAVKPVDSIKGIYTDLFNAAEILKTEGGIGFDFSHLRPRRTIIKGIGAITPGVVEFMTLYDKSAEIITKSNPGDPIQDKGLYIKKKIRKGAQIALLRIEHPEIVDFIEAKSVSNRLTKFNISVSITDAFMVAVIKGKKWDLWFPDVHHPKYDEEWDGDFDAWKKRFPKAVVVYETVLARDLWKKIIENTYTSNDPGIFFVDNANKYNNMLYYQKYVATNPCGEIVMASDPRKLYFDKNGDWIRDEKTIEILLHETNVTLKKFDLLGDICNLGHINVAAYWTLKHGFDWETFKKDVWLLIRALDNLINISGYPFPELKNVGYFRRKIGAGILGYGSLLLMMGLRYGSKKANSFTTELMEIYANMSYQASANLAKEKGSFPLYIEKEFLKNGFVKNSGVLWPETINLMKLYGMRNSALNTTAPTGNTGIYMGIVSGGCEPIFEREFWRWAIITHKMDKISELKDKKYPTFWKNEWYETKDFKFDYAGDEQILMCTDGMFQIDKNRGMTQKIFCEDYGWKWLNEHYSQKVIEEWFKNGWLATAMELSVKEHLDPFKILSHHIDQSVSKTINIPKDYPMEDFHSMFIDLWKSGGRGVTTYREGSRTAVLQSVKQEEKVQEKLDEFFEIWKTHKNGVVEEQVSLPMEYPMKGHIIRTDGKKWYFNIAFKDHNMTKPFAIFIQTNHRESETNTHNAIELLTDLAKSEKIPLEHIETNEVKMTPQNNVNKIARAIGLLLRHNVNIDKVVETLDKIDIPVATFIYTMKKFLLRYVKDGTKSKLTCPECSGVIIYESGCLICMECGYSKC